MSPTTDVEAAELIPDASVVKWRVFEFVGISSFIILQIFRLASLAMFGIFMVDCTLWQSSTSVDCKNFTVYKIPLCDGYCWKVLWLTSSMITSVICLLLMWKRFNPELQPVQDKAIIKRLVKKPFFWSLVLILALVIVYDALIISENRDAKPGVEAAVILWKVITLMLIFQLNYTFPPSTLRHYRRITVLAYYFSLFLFFLDNFAKFTATSAQVAFRFHTVFKNCSLKAKSIVDLMLMVVNGLLYHSYMSFFWNKMFLGEKNVLLVYRTNFVDEFKQPRNENTHGE